MSKKASNFQKKIMSLGYRGKEIFKPLNTGRIDDAYLFTGDTLWFGVDGGYSFINGLAEDNKLAIRSLTALEQKLRERGKNPMIITGHTGWADSLDFAFAHKDKVCNGMRKQKPHDPNAPYDAYEESDDTEEKARSVRLEKANL